MEARAGLSQLLDHILMATASKGVNSESGIWHLGLSGSIEIWRIITSTPRRENSDM